MSIKAVLWIILAVVFVVMAAVIGILYLLNKKKKEEIANLETKLTELERRLKAKQNIQNDKVEIEKDEKEKKESITTGSARDRFDNSLDVMSDD